MRDMWLTGFDAPCLHTMYVDKPMRGHGLMQAIARVNRVFKDKPGGLVVDYLGLAEELRDALAVYAESGGEGEAALDQEQAVAVMTEKVRGVSRPVPRLRSVEVGRWSEERLRPVCRPRRSTSSSRRTAKPGCSKRSHGSRKPSLRVPHDKAIAIRDDVAFFQAVRAVLAKAGPAKGVTPRISTTPSARSSPAPSSPMRWWTSSPPRA